MNIPDKVKIGGFRYSVSEIKNLARDRQRAGESCGNDQTITLEESNSQQSKESTFIHELFEQFNHVYSMGLKHQQIYQLETALYAFIKDNPGVFREEKNEI